MTKSINPALFLLALIGVLSLWFITNPWGAGLSPDSSGYIASARSLLKGEGLKELPRWNGTPPQINFPPLLSFLLAGVGLFGIDPIQGARILNLVFFGANIFLVGFVTFQSTQSRWASLASSFLVLTSLVTLEVHAMVWSEPPFLFFGFLGLFLLALYLDGQAKYPHFLASAGALGLAFLAKYSGVSFVMAGVLATFVLGRKSPLQKIIDCIVMGIVSCFPMLLWLIRNRLLAGRSTELSWYFEPYVGITTRKLLAYPSTWLLPESFPAVIRGLTLMIFLVLLLTASGVVIRRSGEKTVLPWILWFLIGSHVWVYFFSTAFMGEQPFDNRALSPVFIAGLIYGMTMGYELWKISDGRVAVRIALPLFLFVLSTSYGVRAIQWGSQVRKEGLGYASREWKNSQVIKGVKELPSNMPIYTNGLDVVYLLANKPVSSIPAKEDVLKVHVPDRKRRLIKNYSSELERMKKELQATDGVVVYLNKIYWRWYYPTEEELKQSIPLRIFQKFYDGTIYKVKD